MREGALATVALEGKGPQGADAVGGLLLGSACYATLAQPLTFSGTSVSSVCNFG